MQIKQADNGIVRLQVSFPQKILTVLVILQVIIPLNPKIFGRLLKLGHLEEFTLVVSQGYSTITIFIEMLHTSKGCYFSAAYMSLLTLYTSLCYLKLLRKYQSPQLNRRSDNIHQTHSPKECLHAVQTTSSARPHCSSDALQHHYASTEG